MRRWGAGQLLITLLGALLLWVSIALACVCVGSTGSIGWPAEAWARAARVEGVLLASLVGAALASAGVVYQAILRNPLADPYLLGVSSGASLAAFVWRFDFLPAVTALAAAASQQAFAFAGALLALAVVLALSSRRGRLEPVTLILVGVIVNAVNGSLFLLLSTLNRGMAERAGGNLMFLVGGLQTFLERQQEWSAAAVVGAGFWAMWWIAGQLNVAPLSESEAQALGVRIHRLRWFALGVASIVTASAVAVSGPIGFVGLVAPHLARLVVGHDQRRLFPVATALGAALLAVADAGSRFIAREQLGRTLLPVGVLTGLLGGPFFLLLLWQTRRRLEGV